MIVGRSKNNKLHWHALIQSGNVWVLLCKPQFEAKRGSDRQWETRLYMCQDCQHKLDDIEPRWQEMATPKISLIDKLIRQ